MEYSGNETEVEVVERLLSSSSSSTGSRVNEAAAPSSFQRSDCDTTVTARAARQHQSVPTAFPPDTPNISDIPTVYQIISPGPSYLNTLQAPDCPNILRVPKYQHSFQLPNNQKTGAPICRKNLQVLNWQTVTPQASNSCTVLFAPPDQEQFSPFLPDRHSVQQQCGAFPSCGPQLTNGQLAAQSQTQTFGPSSVSSPPLWYVWTPQLGSHPLPSSSSQCVIRPRCSASISSAISVPVRYGGERQSWHSGADQLCVPLCLAPPAMKQPDRTATCRQHDTDAVRSVAVHRHSARQQQQQQQQQPNLHPHSLSSVLVEKYRVLPLSTKAVSSKMILPPECSIVDRETDREWSHLAVKIYRPKNNVSPASGIRSLQHSAQPHGNLQLRPLSLRPPNLNAKTQNPAIENPGSSPVLSQPLVGKNRDIFPRNQGHEQCERSLMWNQRDEKSTGTHLSLDRLPALVILKVLSYLSIPDLVLRVRLTCRYLNEMTYAPDLWRSVNIIHVNMYANKQHFTAQLLRQDCFIAGRRPLNLLDNDMDEVSLAKQQHSYANILDPCIVTRNAEQTDDWTVRTADSFCTERENLGNACLRQSGDHEEHAEEATQEGSGRLAVSQAHSARRKDSGKVNSAQTTRSSIAGASEILVSKPRKDVNLGLVRAEEWVKTNTAQGTPEKKQVKDYIRRLSVDNELQPVVSYVYHFKRKKIVREIENSCLFCNIPVCPRLDSLTIRCFGITPFTIPLIETHWWLTELALTIETNWSGQFSRVTEDDLVTCYKAFQSLKRLKQFHFVFPNSTALDNNAVGNLLFFYSGGLYTEMRKFFEVVTSLEDIVVTDVPDTVMKVIINSCTSLTSLAVSSHVLTHRGFLCQRPLSALQSLTVSCTLSCLDVKIGSAIAKSFPSLTTVNFSDWHGTNDGLEVVLVNCRKLENVLLHDDSGENLPHSNRLVVYPETSLSLLVTPNRSLLRKLSFCADVDDKFLQSLCIRHPVLTSLSLSDCQRITDASLAALAAFCPHLTHVKLNQYHSNVSAKAVLGFLQSCRSLTSLAVMSTTNKGRFVPVTDNYFAVMHGPVGGRPEQDQHSPTAVVLNGDADALPRTDRGKENCPQSAAQIAGEPSGAHQSPGKNPPSCARSKVRELHLGKVPQMTAEDMQVLVQVCPDLLELHLFGCLGLDDSAVEIILRGCPRLRSLTLHRQARGLTSKPCRLTDATLQRLADLGGRLRHFRAWHCYPFSPGAVASLLVTSPSLRSLVLTLGHLHTLKGFADVDHHVRKLLERSAPSLDLRLDVCTRKAGRRARSSHVEVTVAKRKMVTTW